MKALQCKQQTTARQVTERDHASCSSLHTTALYCIYFYSKSVLVHVCKGRTSTSCLFTRCTTYTTHVTPSTHTLPPSSLLPPPPSRDTETVSDQGLSHLAPQAPLRSRPCSVSAAARVRVGRCAGAQALASVAFSCPGTRVLLLPMRAFANALRNGDSLRLGEPLRPSEPLRAKRSGEPLRPGEPLRTSSGLPGALRAIIASFWASFSSLVASGAGSRSWLTASFSACRVERVT